MAKKIEDIVLCQGCLASTPKSKIFIVRKTEHSFFACEKCAKDNYADLPSILYKVSTKLNKTTESFVKNGLTKDNKKVKIGETVKGIVITGIKKIKTTGDLKDGVISEEIKYYITGNRKDWTEI